MTPNLRAFSDQFAEQSDILVHLWKKTSKKVSVSSVHALRISIRRIRAMLWILKRTSVETHFYGLNKNLQKIGKDLNVIRELDVAIRDANKFRLNSSSLKQKRNKCANEISEYLSKKRWSRISRAMNRIIQSLRKNHESNLGIPIKALHARLKNVKAKNDLSPKDLHRLRIKLKKTRYVLEALGKPTEPLKELQACLGRAHDLEMLQELLGKNQKIKKVQSLYNKKAIRLLDHLETH